MKIEGIRSFTLLETLVAISVLLIGIAGSMALVSQNLKVISIFREDLIAANLAQEAMELVRNRRDSDFISRNVGCNEPGCECPSCPDIGCANECIFEAFPPNVAAVDCNLTPCGIRDPLSPILSFKTCPDDDACGIYRNSDGLYNQNGDGNKTIFVRKITIKPISYGGIRHADWAVETEVKWENRFRERIIILKTVLTPWLRSS